MKRDFENASALDWQTALEREAVIAPLAAKSDRTEIDIERVVKALKLSRAMVFRLLHRYIRTPKTSTLLQEDRGRKIGAQLLSEDQEQLIRREIEDFYLTAQRPNLSALHKRVAIACRQARLCVPSYKAIRARVNMVDLKQRVRLRQGKKVASDLFRLVGSGPRAIMPLDLIQIDHTLADVIIVDDVDRQPIGRPWITLAIDVATRVVPGFYIALEHPSAVSVALLIAHAVLPKESYLRQEQIDQEWPVSGLPRCIHLDNGKEFHSQALIRGCKEHGIDLQYRPPKQPTFGGHIERLIGTMMGETHLLPGTTFSSVSDRADYDSGRCAIMTLREFEVWFAWQVVGVYHQQIHAGISMPPIHAWKLSVQKNPSVIRDVMDPKGLYLDFLPFQLRKVRRDGIRLFNIQYCASALEPLAGRSEQQYVVKYDPRDLSRVYLKEAPGEYVTVPYRDLSRPPITLWEHRRATKELHAQGRLAVHEDNLFAAIESQRRVIEKARVDTQSARRRAQQSRNAGKARATTQVKQVIKPGADIEPVGPVTPYPFEVWDDH